MKPDSTPPDDSLFPISPCYTADLDAKALDEIVTLLRTFLDGKANSSDAIEAIGLRVIRTGREI